MKSFKQYISESFVNAVAGKSDELELKKKYVDQVWDILQDSYKDIGGIKGSGFESKDAMIKKIPFWKLAVKDGVVHAVILYKDKGGRKSVAMGVNGSDFSKKKVKDMLASDIKRSYGEKSKGALGALLKTVPWDILQQYIKTPAEAQKILGADDEVVPVTQTKDNIPEDGVKTLEKFPELWKYAYTREIGGKPVFKVMLGSAGNKIK